MARPMTPEEAAEFLEVDAKTVLKWARSSYLPGHRLGEGKRGIWRFVREELEQWLARQNNGKKVARG